MSKRARPSLRLGLVDPKKKTWLSPTVVDLGIAGSGLALGLISFPYRESPIGQTLLVAGGGLVAVALAFLIRDLLTSRAIEQAVKAS
jgi:hypothetical protein